MNSFVLSLKMSVATRTKQPNLLRNGSEQEILSWVVWNFTTGHKEARRQGRLGQKAFPSSQEKEFDRMLKGRFFQALHVKWQRKLGAPKPQETFRKLYNRARTLE